MMRKMRKMRKMQNENLKLENVNTKVSLMYIFE